MRALLVVCLFFIWASGVSAIEGKSPEKERPSEAKHKNSASQPAVPQVAITINSDGGRSQATNTATDSSNKKEANPEEVWAWRATSVSGLMAVLAFAIACGALGVAWKQMGMFRSQLSHMEKTFLYANRPRLVLRDAMCEINWGEPRVVFVRVSNTGNSIARIVESHVVARIVERNKLRLFGISKDEGKNVFETDKIKPGGYAVDSFEYGVWETQSVASQGTIIGDTFPFNHDFIVTGQIVYADEAGLKQEMAFYRVFDIETQKFLRPNYKDIDQLDYN